MSRQLTRSETDRVLAGVAGGIAQRFEINSTLVRLAWVLSVLFGGLGILAYLILAIVLPQPTWATWAVAAALAAAGVVMHRTAHGAGGRTPIAASAVAVTITARGLLGIAIDFAGGIEGPYQPLDLAIYSPTALAIGLGAAWLLRTSPKTGTRAPAVLSPFPKKMSEAAS
jgi:phage shock protein PspC (stress-responsive transcriptional regulator)